MADQDGELLFSVRKIAPQHYVAERAESPAFRLEGKTITEVTQKAIRVFDWRDDDAS